MVRGAQNPEHSLEEGHGGHRICADSTHPKRVNYLIEIRNGKANHGWKTHPEKVLRDAA
jgi:hypothetical protein